MTQPRSRDTKALQLLTGKHIHHRTPDLEARWQACRLHPQARPFSGPGPGGHIAVYPCPSERSRSLSHRKNSGLIGRCAAWWHKERPIDFPRPSSASTTFLPGSTFLSFDHFSVLVWYHAFSSFLPIPTYLCPRVTRHCRDSVVDRDITPSLSLILWTFR